MPKKSLDIEHAYRDCEQLAFTHYENFPVASRLLPKKIRRPIAVLYAFARHADDIIDEGSLSPPERLQQLTDYEQALKALSLKSRPPQSSIFIALADVLEKHPHLPIHLLFDLLSAFKQDIVKSTYKDFDELLAYCQLSANPIGRLLLHLTHNDTPQNLTLSDSICSALQCINFLQDLNSDLHDRNRCYLPHTDMQTLGVSIEMLKAQQTTPAIKRLIDKQYTRAEQLLNAGLALPNQLSGLFGFEIRLVIASAELMLSALRKRDNVYQRPIFTRWHGPVLLWKTIQSVCLSCIFQKKAQ